MSILSIRIPDSLHESVKSLSKQDHISINQFIASAVAEKITAIGTENYIKERASKGNRAVFLKALEKVPDSVPEDFDK